MRAEKKELTPERLRELLSYDGATGEFRWRKDGGAAGVENHDGYLVFRIDRKQYYAHRLAWLYTHGVWPDNSIDHINGARDDNRLLNLRSASHAENIRNRVRMNKNNTSGCRGVWLIKSTGKWRVRMKFNYKGIHIGCYNTKHEANLAYTKKAGELSGEFAGGSK